MMQSVKFPSGLWNRINDFKEKEGLSFAGAVKRLAYMALDAIDAKEKK